VTPGNSSGVNDGAEALLIASGGAVMRLGLTPPARKLAEVDVIEAFAAQSLAV
jgi:acetyl-CoA acetyltransferase